MSPCERFALGDSVHRMLRRSSLVGVAEDVAVVRLDEGVLVLIGAREIRSEIGEIVDVPGVDAVKRENRGQEAAEEVSVVACRQARIGRGRRTHFADHEPSTRPQRPPNVHIHPPAFC